MSTPDKVMKLKDGKILYDDARTRIEELKVNKAPIITNTLSGTSVHIEDAAELPFEKLAVNFGPVQEGSGDPSPSNIRPIYGWSKIPVQHHPNTEEILAAVPEGKFGTIDLATGIMTVTYEYVALKDLSWSVRTSGSNYVWTASTAENHTPSSTQKTHFCDIFPTAYTDDWAHSKIGELTFFNSTNKSTYLTFNNISTSEALATWLETYNPHVCYFLATAQTLQLSNIPLSSGTVSIVPFQLGGGTPSLTNIRKIIQVLDGPSIDLGDTYYGGTVDLVSGTMTVTMIYYSLTGNMFSDFYGADTDKPRLVTYNFYSPIGIGTAGGQKIVASDKTKVYPDGTGTEGDNSTIPYVSMSTSSTQNMGLYFPTSYNITSLAEGRAWVDANQPKIIFTLATPQTVTLTPQTINALRGENNISSPSGSIEITYRADTKDFITNSINVNDVQINGNSILNNGIANIPIASANDAGVAKVNSSFGIGVFNSGVVTNTLAISAATSNQIKTANPAANATYFRPIVPDTQHEATFYGLSKVAGVDLGEETVTLGTYPASSKGAIQSMLGISDLIAPEENTLVASQAYSVNDIFTANGKLYSVTSAIASGETIIVQNNGETVSGSKAKETTIAAKFVKKTDYAVNAAGTVRVDNTGLYGLKVNSNNGTIFISNATGDLIKSPSGDEQHFKPITPSYQHAAVFYGLAKAAGDATQSSSSNSVGTYTDAAKTAIKTMLGVEEGLKVVRLI